MSLRMSDVLGKPVIDVATGKRLGRAWDVRVRRMQKSRQIGEEVWRAEALVISRTGALERFGIVHLRRTHPAGNWRSPRQTVPWDAIETVGPRAIKVRIEEQ